MAKIFKLRNTLHEIRDTQQICEQILKLFLQNKPNFKISGNVISVYSKSGSDNFNDFGCPKNKAKQSQFKPNFDLKMALFFPNKPNSLVSTKSRCYRDEGGKPISSNLEFETYALITCALMPDILGNYPDKQGRTVEGVLHILISETFTNKIRNFCTKKASLHVINTEKLAFF